MAVETPTEICSNRTELEALCAGNLPPSEVARVLRHVVDCDACYAFLRSAGYSLGSSAAVQRPAHGDTMNGDKPLQSSCDTGTSAALASPRVSMLPPGDGDPSWRGMLAPPQEPDELGRLGGYRILRVLGEGGMGIVFEAEDLSLERRVAIKVLWPGEIDLVQRKRFVQEAQLAASLSSDHIVTIHQVGEDAGRLFIVMELLRGENLESRLGREKSLSLVEALRIVREVAEGLCLAHERKLVHRDIKPANIWLEAKRADAHPHRVKLLDFGVARPIAINDRLTACGNIVGTPAYMSPEQACASPIDERSDLFSLGCVLYAMLAGQSPFERENYLESLKAVVDERPPALDSIPSRVANFVDRLLEKDAGARPAGARHVVEELRLLELSYTSTGMVAPEPTAIAAPRTGSRWQRLTWGALAGALAILVAAGLGAWSQYDRLVGSRSHSASKASADTSVIDKAHRFASDTPRETAPPQATDAIPAATPLNTAPANLPTLKIGIIHSLTGPMATSERPIVDTFLMAVDEINAAGGLLGGRRIEALVRDGKSNEFIFAEQAEKLIVDEQVVTLFGCWRSPCRKLVEEVCRRHNHLLVFPTTYEGLEQSPYVIYMGGAPNQQIVPATKWAFAFLEKRKFFLIGADGLYSHCAHEIIRDELASLGGKVVGEAYRPLGDTDFNAIARQVADSGADVVINTVSGAGNISLFNCLRHAGIAPDKVPTISLKVTEEELQNVSSHSEDLVGDYAAWSYFQSLPGAANQAFIERLQTRYGPTRVATDPMAAAYAGMYLWSQAVRDCRTDRVEDIRAVMQSQSFEAPEGALAVNRNHHAKRKAIIGQVGADLQFDIVWNSPKPIDPEPFPPSRSRAQWETFQNDLRRSWDGNWRPNAPVGKR